MPDLTDGCEGAHASTGLVLPPITAWYLPGDPGFWVLRSPAGRLWALPTVSQAWAHGLRFRVEREPTCPPVPTTLGRKIAHLLGVPGFQALDAEDETVAGLEVVLEWQMLEERLAGLTGVGK